MRVDLGLALRLERRFRRARLKLCLWTVAAMAGLALSMWLDPLPSALAAVSGACLYALAEAWLSVRRLRREAEEALRQVEGRRAY